jgi:hypothetical protein
MTLPLAVRITVPALAIGLIFGMISPRARGVADALFRAARANG